MPETVGNFVSGEWTVSETGETFVVENPADPDDVVAHFQQSSAADTEAAIEAAADAQAEWADMPAPDRGRILTRTAQEIENRQEELTETLVREEGKARPEAAGEVQRAVDIFYYYAEKARDLGGDVKAASGRDTNLYTVGEPLGVAGLITPWNYPIAIPAWKLAPALVTGNTVVIKPASQAPNVARKLVECLEAAGIPDGVVNFVTGPGSEVGTELTTNESVDAISFTGSGNVGDVVYQQAAEDQKRVQLEMGGKNPTLVTENADVEEAAEVVGSGAFGVTGQACTATSRAIVHESVYDAFVAELVEYAESLSIGPGLDDYDMGPQVSASELDGTLTYIDVGTEEGATLETGGAALDDGEYDSGHFVEPTVFSDVSSDMRIAQEEIFGPVVGVIPVSDFEEGVAVANDTQYGLAASVVTDDLTEANRFVDEVEAGVVKVNEKTTGLELHVPFGGMKASSSETYREQGDAGLDFFTTTKTVYANY
ncbi:aldehyde dehydrogenase family protein [Haloarchaeobius amylolyticus]|uniref:2,5-dioxovalerate dehydrogenase n=1 Tax=Haloarchaeobius amylolyticus TaxID=1198296 RepID=UPI00226EB1D9|nr:aldehyde dehydrogenase family protein [Haloarchaeobius amylolyticus]